MKMIMNEIHGAKNPDRVDGFSFGSYDFLEIKGKHIFMQCGDGGRRFRDEYISDNGAGSLLCCSCTAFFRKFLLDYIMECEILIYCLVNIRIITVFVRKVASTWPTSISRIHRIFTST